MYSRLMAVAAGAIAVHMASMGVCASATPTLLFEPDTGRVLYAEEPDRAWHPASVTKLMTAYLTFEAVEAGRIAWDDDVPLSDYARAQPATRIGLRGGIKLNIEQAVRGLILRSANDFAVALAERISGSEPAFVDTMNATARRLGMTRTFFRNPHGLPDAEQVTTARDLALLTIALLRDYPGRAEVFSTPTVRIHKGTFHSQNDLLRTLEGVDGLKTGFTCASGYNVVASATRDGRRLVAIVLGAVNRQKRSERAAELLEAGFNYRAADAGTTLPFLAPPAKAIPAKARKIDVDVPAPLPFAPVHLAAMALSPAEPSPPEDIARQVRSGKCRGYSGFPNTDDPEPIVSEAEKDRTAPPAVTGSVTAQARAVRNARQPTTSSTSRQAESTRSIREPAGPGATRGQE